MTDPATAPTATRTAAAELARSQLLSAFIGGGLFFMLVPGTFLGVLNLVQISSRESVALVSQAWLQAHGHAQVFGWVGSFILGIGFYSIPTPGGGSKPALACGWASWGMWSAGVAMRWAAGVSAWQWRLLLPVSSLLELTAFLVFLGVVFRHRPAGSTARRFEPWVRTVISATVGLSLVLVANTAASVYVSWRGDTPALPHALDQRFLVLVTWGFLAPFVWGFTARWMPVFLGLQATRHRLLAVALVATGLGVLLSVLGWGAWATGLFVFGAALAAAALRLFEPTRHPPKTRGVHPSFPFFVRAAYGWLLIAAVLGVAAAVWDTSGGIWGASRHAFTVGFVAVMIFSVGQRVLPAFVGAHRLWSPELMFAGLILLTTGCALRVTSEVLAYQDYASWAWSVLPVSAVIELTAVTLFAANLVGTFFLQERTA
ncbi:MAG TPA: NnrS family protein [Vicinamibacterales bacterium]